MPHKSWAILILAFILLTGSCSNQKDQQMEQPEAATAAENPFFSDFETPFGTPPFDKIKEEHFLPAFKEGIERQRKEIAAITSNEEAPTFENTIEALEYSGELLTKVSNVFDNLDSANTNETMQAIAKETAPMLSQLRDDINLNEDLFSRIKAVYETKDQLALSPEQNMLQEKIYQDFVRGGANLSPEDKETFRKINQELALLSLQFGENVLKETNAFELVIENEEDLSGLPDDVISAAAEAAKERGHLGKWVFTLHKPSMIPFLQYSKKRDLREKIFKAYINRGNNNNEYDNKAILSKMAALRVKRAQLLGYDTHAHFVLEQNMAQVPENVYDLLSRLWDPAVKMAKMEAKDLQKLIKNEGQDFKLEPWDWWYYAEQLKKAKYDLDDEIIRPYFKLENVRDGVFYVANQLFGLQFIERTDIPKYHPDVTVFEVQEADGAHVGILYTDYFPRASKRGGAWMNSFRKQYHKNGKMITPIICNVGNFTKPTGDKPSLLTFEEAATMFHEFGHALHGLLSDCTYRRLSGTAVPRDFVELPSQIMENWALHPEVIKIYAKHYQTGEPIPQELLDKINNARLFNLGFATVEYLAASFLDMDWHTLEEPVEKDPIEFEDQSMEKIGLIPEIVVRYRSPYFSHIFSGGYSAGYYSYIWAEVLDADAFEAFKQKGLFDQETAQALRKHIYSAGGTDEPMELYKKFRGHEPKVEPLLRRKGFIE